MAFAINDVLKIRFNESCMGALLAAMLGKHSLEEKILATIRELGEHVMLLEVTDPTVREVNQGSWLKVTDEASDVTVLAEDSESRLMLLGALGGWNRDREDLSVA
jgi:hypothetical protein